MHIYVHVHVYVYMSTSINKNNKASKDALGMGAPTSVLAGGSFSLSSQGNLELSLVARVCVRGPGVLSMVRLRPRMSTRPARRWPAHKSAARSTAARPRRTGAGGAL